MSGQEGGSCRSDAATTAGRLGGVDRTATAFLAALGGRENIIDLENCATRLRMEVAGTTAVDEATLKRAGAAGTMKPGGQSVQVVYGTSVQFVKDAMEDIVTGKREPVESGEPGAVADATGGADGSTATAVRTSSLVRLRQPVAGTVVPLSEVPDPTFAGGIMGPGVAIEPTSGEVVAPAAGTITHVFPTGHAVALTLDDGTEVLVHVGLDTVKLQGEGFTTLVETGEHVTAGTPLLRADLSAIRVAGYETVTPVIVLNDKEARIELI